MNTKPTAGEQEIEAAKEYDDTNLLQWLKEREQNRNLPALRDELAKAKL